MSTIGDRIKQARESAGLTQQQLADAIGIPSYGRQRVNHWESGARAPGRAYLVKIAEALDKHPAWIEFGDGLPKVD